MSTKNMTEVLQFMHQIQPLFPQNKLVVRYHQRDDPFAADQYHIVLKPRFFGWFPLIGKVLVQFMRGPYEDCVMNDEFSDRIIKFIKEQSAIDNRKNRQPV